MKRCEDCRYHEMVGVGAGGIEFQCHRLPPAILLHGEGFFTTWPHVNSDDWCGEWEATK